MKQDVNWNSRTSTARSAYVPGGLLAGRGLDLSKWVSDGTRGEIQAAADVAVHKLTHKLSAASQKKLYLATLCRQCCHLK